ncbi:hypothetical protein DSL64_11750 [Dyadobacter luteus]|uniref:Nucleotidyltransferase family protein n=1 Tax=Dyadobacter luteus TaxID=2259619 RepID=A0A3D8YBV0_9BACT|nr:nucleotidyltransferase family protein [Dyadobacter luteus]REA61631.1 hypothetical protein DSL64_11750 [Dyadobacter luteus]
MPAQFSDEMNLLLSACLQTRLTDASNPDEVTLKRMVRYHGVRPQFLNYLHQSGISVSFQKELIEECQRIAFINLLSLRELSGLFNILKENGVVCYAYKGSVWADWLYGDVGKREFGDIDLLIDRATFQQALKLLAKAGYHPDPYRQFLLESKSRTEAFFRTDYHIPLENTASATSSMVEAHWEVAYPRLHFQFPSGEWNQFHKEYTIQNIKIDAFSNEYQFLLLLVHHGGKEQWSRLKYIADFSAFMIRWGSEIDWNLVAKLAREKGIYTLLVRSLGLLKSLGLPWRDAWQIQPEAVDVTSFIKTWTEMPPAASNSSWPYFLHGMSVHDGLKHKSKVLTKHLEYLSEVGLLLDKARWYRQNPNSDVL